MYFMMYTSMASRLVRLNISIGHLTHSDDSRTLVEGSLIPNGQEEPALIVNLFHNYWLGKQFLEVEETAGQRFIKAILNI
jgi:hypothetical protein